MAKVNNIKINGTTRYIENISYQTALPTATNDSADFVSVNNELYAKQVNNGVYSYAKVGSEGGVKVIEKTLNEEMTDFVDTFTEEELNDFINGSILKVKRGDDRLAYYLTPRVMQHPYEEMYGVIFSGFLYTDTGEMLEIAVINTSGEINAQITTTSGKFAVAVEITDVPNTATNGTLTDYELQTLQASDSNYIMFNNEKYYLNDKGHTEGYLTYSHVGVVSEDIFVKVITITISTRGWVLIEQQVNAGGGGGAPITLVDTLPEANEENFEKGKIYSTGALLNYISRVAIEEAVLSQVNSLPKTLNFSSAAAVGTDVYVYTKYQVIYKYSTTTNTVTTISSTAFMSGLGDASAAAVGTDIYIFGGYDNNTRFKKIYKYSTTTNTVTTMSATLPVGLSGTSAAAVGNNIYIFGGYTGSARVNTIYKYSTTTNTVTTMSATLPQGLNSTSAAVVGTDIYIFGGYGDSRANTIYKYSTTTNTVTTMSATLPVGLSGTSAAAVGNNIYIFGGYGDSRVDTIYQYSTATDTITTMPTTLPHMVSATSAAAVGNNIYIFGGSLSGGNLDTIYQYALGFRYSYTFKTISTE